MAADDSPCMQPASDVTVLATFVGPPPTILTAEQRQRICVNRQLAVQRQKAKRLREVRAFPVSHVQPDLQEESSQQVMPLLPMTHLTSSHRRRFAFGRVTPDAARHFLAIQHNMRVPEDVEAPDAARHSSGRPAENAGARSGSSG